jgi:hypothetical protein
LLRLNPKLQHPFPKKLTKEEIEAWEAARTAAMAARPVASTPQQAVESVAIVEKSLRSDAARKAEYEQWLAGLRQRVANGEDLSIKGGIISHSVQPPFSRSPNRSLALHAHQPGTSNFLAFSFQYDRNDHPAFERWLAAELL